METKNTDIEFDLSKYNSWRDVANTFLNLGFKKKDLLEKFKDSKHILPKEIFDSIINDVNETITEMQKPLRFRKAVILKEELEQEKLNETVKEISITKRKKITDDLKVKLLKYENKLYKRQQRILYCRYKKELKTLYSYMRAQEQAKTKTLMPP